MIQEEFNNQNDHPLFNIEKELISQYGYIMSVKQIAEVIALKPNTIYIRHRNGNFDYFPLMKRGKGKTSRYFAMTTDVARYLYGSK